MCFLAFFCHFFDNFWCFFEKMVSRRISILFWVQFIDFFTFFRVFLTFFTFYWFLSKFIDFLSFFYIFLCIKLLNFWVKFCYFLGKKQKLMLFKKWKMAKFPLNRCFFARNLPFFEKVKIYRFFRFFVIFWCFWGSIKSVKKWKKWKNPVFWG